MPHNTFIISLNYHIRLVKPYRMFVKDQLLFIGYGRIWKNLARGNFFLLFCKKLQAVSSK